jgi:hypothetical protein
MRKLVLALSLMAAAALALAGAASRTSAQGSGLLEFVDIDDCPGPCPPGASPCCAYAPEICAPDPCERT